MRTILIESRPAERLFGFERNGTLFGTALVQLTSRGWDQVRRDPFDPADRFLVTDLTGDLVFTLNRLAA